jgi:hypothetical protein
LRFDHINIAAPAALLKQVRDFWGIGFTSTVSRLDDYGVEFRVSSIPELKMTQLFFKDPAGTGLEVNFIDEHLA